MRALFGGYRPISSGRITWGPDGGLAGRLTEVVAPRNTWFERVPVQCKRPPWNHPSIHDCITEAGAFCSPICNFWGLWGASEKIFYGLLSIAIFYGHLINVSKPNH